MTARHSVADRRLVPGRLLPPAEMSRLFNTPFPTRRPPTTNGGHVAAQSGAHRVSRSSAEAGKSAVSAAVARRCILVNRALYLVRSDLTQHSGVEEPDDSTLESAARIA